MITAGKDCQGCIYNEPIDKYYNHCSARDKKYHYGQWVPCEDKKPLDITLPMKAEETVKEVEETVVKPAKEESVKKTRKTDKTSKKKRGE